MRDRSFQLSFLVSLVLHAGLVAGVCTLAAPVFAPSEMVFNVEISAEPAAALGPGGGSADMERSVPVQAALPRAVAIPLKPAALKPQVFSLKPALRKTEHKPAAAPASPQVAASAKSDCEGSVTARGDGQGPLDGFGSPLGIPGGTGTGSAAQIRLISAPKPPFPRAARRDGFEGRAVFDVLVSADGSLQNVTINQGSGRQDCDEAALNTIKDKWRFAAAVLNGQPVSAWGRVSVRYQLQ